MDDFSQNVRKRALHRKVRTGCVTCKIRRIKCDETRPLCRRCTSTGRICDGYDLPLREQPRHERILPRKTSPIDVEGSDSAISRLPSKSLTPRPSTPERSESPENTDISIEIPTNLGLTSYTEQNEEFKDGKGSEESSPVAPYIPPANSTPGEARLLERFHIRLLDAFVPTISDPNPLKDLLRQCCETEPAVRHAVIALSASHCYFMWRANNVEAYRNAGEIAFQHYNTAISLTRSYAHEYQDAPSIPLLLTCLLFAELEFLLGRPEFARMHNVSGIRLAASTRRLTTNGNGLVEDIRDALHLLYVHGTGLPTFGNAEDSIESVKQSTSPRTIRKLKVFEPLTLAFQNSSASGHETHLTDIYPAALQQVPNPASSQTTSIPAHRYSTSFTNFTEAIEIHNTLNWRVVQIARPVFLLGQNEGDSERLRTDLRSAYGAWEVGFLGLYGLKTFSDFVAAAKAQPRSSSETFHEPAGNPAIGGRTSVINHRAKAAMFFSHTTWMLLARGLAVDEFDHDAWDNEVRVILPLLEDVMLETRRRQESCTVESDPPSYYAGAGHGIRFGYTTSETCWLFYLFYFRDPLVRRKIIWLMEESRTGFGIWNWRTLLPLLERWLSLEEDGIEKLETSADIPVWKRLCWVGLDVRPEERVTRMMYEMWTGEDMTDKVRRVEVLNWKEDSAGGRRTS